MWAQAVYNKTSWCIWTYMDIRIHQLNLIGNVRKQMSLDVSVSECHRRNNSPPALGSAKHDTTSRIVYNGHVLL